MSFICFANISFFKILNITVNLINEEKKNMNQLVYYTEERNCYFNPLVKVVFNYFNE